MTKSHKLVIAFILFISQILLTGGHAKAAGTEMFITWHADSFVPAMFTGKALPTTGSSITASVLLVSNNKIVSLSGQKVYWYVNGNFAGNERRVTFKVPGMAPNSIELRAELPDFGDGSMLKTIQIPVVRPEVVIDTPFPSKRMTNGTTTIFAYPFFFSIQKISSLIYSWELNNNPVDVPENPNRINISSSDILNGGVTIGVGIRNPREYSDKAGRVVNLLAQ
jgi:hypothetical protein